MNRPITDPSRSTADVSNRRPALAAGVALLAIAVLAPIAQFGILQQLIVPADAAASVDNILAASGLFTAAIAALLVVAVLDIVVAWGLYRVLRPADERLARLVAGSRVIYAAMFAVALVNLMDVTTAVQGASASAGGSALLQSRVATSLAAFDGGWSLALGVFGLHLGALGVLLGRSAAPRWLAGLVILAGAGYVVDSLATILGTDYAFKVSTFTFVGEALLIFWLLWIALRGVRTPRQSGAAASASARTAEQVAS